MKTAKRIVKASFISSLIGYISYIMLVIFGFSNYLFGGTKESCYCGFLIIGFITIIAFILCWVNVCVFKRKREHK